MTNFFKQVAELIYAMACSYMHMHMHVHVHIHMHMHRSFPRVTAVTTSCHAMIHVRFKRASSVSRRAG